MTCKRCKLETAGMRHMNVYHCWDAAQAKIGEHGLAMPDVDGMNVNEGLMEMLDVLSMNQIHDSDNSVKEESMADNDPLSDEAETAVVFDHDVVEAAEAMVAENAAISDDSDDEDLSDEEE